MPANRPQRARRVMEKIHFRASSHEEPKGTDRTADTVGSGTGEEQDQDQTREKVEME